jgi:Putative mono-oxygenase ydhR
MNFNAFLASATLGLSVLSAQAQMPANVGNPLNVLPKSNVVSIVTVPKPWYAPRALVISKMRDTQSQYETLAGLQYKIYTFRQTDSQFGGIYLWNDSASAQAWFNPAWFERVRQERGVEGVVRYVDAPVVLDNKKTPNQAGQVATFVTIPIPAGVTREKLVDEFNAAVPTYQRITGLLRKYFIVTPDGQFGGIYLWDSQANADQWFSPAWHQRVRDTYGKAAALEWFDAPILLPSKNPL